MSEISVVVVGSTSINSVVGNGDTVNVNVGGQGGGGAAATIEAGTVTTIDATQTATVTNVGTAYAAKFNFSLPRGLTGSTGPANSLSISKVSTGTTAAVSISGTAPSQALSFVLQPGPTGPANSLSIGSVSTGTTAAVSISGSAPSQSLSFVLPQGPSGPATSLSIGSVSTGATAAVSISGAAPSQALSFVLQPGPTGPATSLSIGSVSTGTTAAVSISGAAPSQSLSFVLQPGPTGPANSLSIGSVSTGTTAAVSISGAAPSQSLSFVLQPGPTGPANSLSIGSVSTGATAAVSISGTSPSQSLSFVLQPGPTGPANSLSIGSVSTGTTAAVSITGSAPSQSLSFVLPVGPRGDAGPQGPAGPPINLTDETPQPLGTASAGTALAAARADHVHSQGSIAYSGLTGIPSTFAPSAHSHAVADVTGLQAALDSKQAAGTYATLVNNLVPSANLPSFVDDVIDVGGTLPATGDVGKIYVVSAGGNTNKIYRWSGSAFIEISPSPGSTDSVTEGSTNLYYTNARASAAAPVQSVAGRTGVITVAQLGSSGTASSTTFLRGDGAWATAGSTDASSLASGTVPSARLPLATTTAAGAVIVGSGLAVASGVLSTTGGGNASIVEAATAAGFPATGSVGTIYHASDVRRLFFWDATGGVYVEAGTSGGGGGGGGGGGIASVVEVATYAALPSPGLVATIYIVKNTSQIYRFDGTSSTYVELSPDSSTDSLLRSLFRPGPPTSVTAVAGNAQATVTWTAPTDVLSQTPITDYTVQYSASSGSSWSMFADGTSTATSATVTGLQNGTAYVFRVAAVNALGTGTYSTPSAAVTPSAGGSDPNISSVSLLLHMEGTTLVDSSSNNLTVTALEDGSTPTNPYLVTAQKKFGSKSFSGAGAAYPVYAETQTSSALGFGTGDFCLEGWCFTNFVSAAHQYLFYLPNGIYVSLFRASIDFGPQLMINNGSWLYSNTSTPNNQWNYIAVSRTSGQLNAYVNGTLALSVADTRNYGASDKFYTAINLNGYVDEIRVSKGTGRSMTGSTITVPTTAFPDS